MTQFDKDYRYVKSKFLKIYTPVELSIASKLKNDFINKYVILISHTDKRFTEIQNELNDLELQATKKLSSDFYFNKN